MQGIARDLSIVQWAGRRATLRTVLYGAGAVAVTAVLAWLGLAYVVTHAEGSLPDEVRADIVVPLAGTPDRRVYANVLVEQGVAASLGSTLIDMRCLQPGARHIRCATGIRNTIDEAILLKRIFEEESIAHAIIVTSSYHLARATAVFSVIFAGTGIDVRFASPPDVPLSTDSVSREVKSYLPSLGAALLARLVPPAYEWVRLISPVCPDALRGLPAQSPV
ncbi:MAG TPA: ElyC/SanA/YdcF family protein [Nitrospira sp.]|nr:ElyC/SanA/YdcF family protein [Nitrospira sp.]